ncbi:hypothetical protein BGZ83_010232 [Gryganskiella cystojenkinii]|nr:hypothetical protein BGZ83_010232 [Gryganskiella cystojenkinii]
MLRHSTIRLSASAASAATAASRNATTAAARTALQVAAKRTLHTTRTTLLSSTARQLSQSNRNQDRSFATQAGALPHVETTKDHDIVITSGTNKTPTTLNPIWLRDNCPCPECIHPSTRQKLHASSQIPLDIQATTCKATPEGLELTWSKGLEDVGDWEDPKKSQPGHKSVYSWDMVLGSYGSTPKQHRTETRMNHPAVLWDEKMMTEKVLWLDYEEYAKTEEGLLKALKHLQDYGLVFVRGVPTDDQEVVKVAERIGHLRETFYGRTWDVKSVPDAKNIAYTNLNLGLHMDLLYFEAPPGLQLLHSLENSVPGGTSIFMDSFKAVQLLKEEHPEDYEILTKTSTTFHYRNGDHHLHFNRPTIAVDPLNDTLTVNYAPPFQGPLELATTEEMKAFYRALKNFARYIERPDLQYRHTMRPGECMIFANRRVLHARTAFDPTKGKRHLKGCYVDLDMFRDKYRTTLQAKLEGKF